MIRSKLPHVGTTIFTVMTNRARELNAINLAQGFPDYDAPAKLKDLVAYHVAAGHNQYAPMIGVPQLREQIALKLGASYGRLLDSETEITITLGATEGIFSAVQALVHPGDEVILFDPSYDSYAPAVLLAGGRPIHVPLDPPRFQIDWQRVRQSLSPRTRLVILNTPQNPSATIASASDLDVLADLLRPTPAMVLSDEVYEHMIFDGERHASIVGHPELYERGVAVFSFGKTMHATGWRVGYTVAPRGDHARDSPRASVQHLQHRRAAAVRDRGLPQGLARAQLAARAPSTSASATASSTACATPVSAGRRRPALTSSCSTSARFRSRATSSLPTRCCARPASRRSRCRVFYATPPKLSVLRFCFAKNDSTLEEAAERLCRV